MNNCKRFFTYLQYLAFGIHFFFLPIAKSAAVQSISASIFIFLIIVFNYKKWKINEIYKIKSEVILFLCFICLGYFSLIFTVDFNETMKEVSRVFLKNSLIMVILFFYFKHITISELKIYIYIILSSLIIHSCINIYSWYLVDFSFNYRAGGLLDGYLLNGGGQRFGIWATYAFAIPVSMFLLKSKNAITTILFILCSFSIVANNTRATYLGAVLIVFCLVFLFLKSRNIKFIILFCMSFAFLSLYLTLDKTNSKRYAFTDIPKYIELACKQPNEMSIYKKMGLDFSIASRISMWKSVLIYRSKEPLKPTGYGRFLYGKTITKVSSQKNKPFVVFPQVHNEFIGVFFSLGLFGLILFLYIILSHFKTAFDLSKSNIREVSFIGYFSFFGCSGFCASLFFGNFFGSSEAKLFYLLFGMILGVLHNEVFKNDKYLRA